MILSDHDIAACIDAGSIKIDPFDPKNLGPNSYDVHLSPHLATYSMPVVGRDESPMAHFLRIRDGRPLGTIYGLDAAKEPEIDRWMMPSDGDLLIPGWLYLASTLEYTETHLHVPYLDGKSSVGRLGISVHVTAGRGDIGFCGHWTMEITVVHPVRVYAGMPIGQLTYHMPLSQPSTAYNQRTTGAQYSNRDPLPQPSRMWKNFPPTDKPSDG